MVLDTFESDLSNFEILRGFKDDKFDLDQYFMIGVSNGVSVSSIRL